jgi:LysR family transcriptional regulator (chromosome initiation inhibitor)
MLENNDLKTLLAVVEEGSFDAAARLLSITPGAVSQRVKQLEEKMGEVLVKRTSPPVPTEAGEIVLRMAQQVRLLNSETVAALRKSGQQTQTRLTIAINDGSLATWFLPTIVPFLLESGILLDLRIGDHTQTNQMLREGTAVMAITSDSEIIQGCRSELVRQMQFVGIAAPRFHERYFAKGITVNTLQKAPMILCDRQDKWTPQFVKAAIGRSVKPPTHYVPTTRSAVAAVKLGLGWRVSSLEMVQDSIDSGNLVNIAPNTTLTMPIYLQSYRIKSRILDAAIDIIRNKILS